MAEWLGEDTDLVVNTVTVSEPNVDVVLVGPTRHPEIEDLEAAPDGEALGIRPIATVTEVPATTETFSETGGKTSSGPSPPYGACSP